MYKSDSQIKREVENELYWDSRTWNLGLKVKVSDGVVTLTGVVPSFGQKLLAQNAAHKVTGVLDVANDLIVKPERAHSDTEIAQAVRDALIWDVLVPDEQIRSTVSDGVIKLEGKVQSLRQKKDVERAVRNLKGVSGVINILQIDVGEVDENSLRESIESALERRADREAERLSLVIKGSEVDISGRVHSRREREAVVGSISHAPGVTKINDNLRIDPYF